ncbi:MAG: GNAT family N-acetyltransferase [Dysgonamonadaceae bacterium]|nr:GNAT family N-acetyltransferase [Dysgonamonadaceae bacterium]
MGVTLDIDTKIILKKAEAFCAKENIEIKLINELPDSLLEVISKRTNEVSTLYYASVDMLKNRLKNGCFVLIKDEHIYGHIFVHKHQFKEYFIYERSTLWIDSKYRKYNLGLLLMERITDLYNDTFLISIARTPKVHYYNELLGMRHITLSEMSTMLVEELEKLGKLRDEKNYRYYINAYFDSKIQLLK